MKQLLNKPCRSLVAAVIRNFGDRYFAGSTLVMTNSLLGDHDIDINYRKWRTRLFFGVRF